MRFIAKILTSVSLLKLARAGSEPDAAEVVAEEAKPGEQVADIKEEEEISEEVASDGVTEASDELGSTVSSEIFSDSQSVENDEETTENKE